MYTIFTYKNIKRYAIFVSVHLGECLFVPHVLLAPLASGDIWT